MKKINIMKKINLSFAILALGALFIIAVPIASADNLQQQINDLQNKNQAAQSNLDSLQVQATSYQNAISILQSQINAAQAAINASQQSIINLQVKIDKAQTNLDYQKKVLASDVKAIYLSGSVNTIEMLASSSNLSVFVDRATYQKAVEGKIQTTLNQIATLQNQLNTQKDQVQQTLIVEKTQNDQLASDQQKQQSMLGYNQGQQDKYNQDISTNKDKIATLRTQQAILNSVGSGNIIPPNTSGSGGACDAGQGQGNGGYPMLWCDAPEDSVTTSGYFPNRECTSFAYWYFTSVEGHRDFTVTGDAKYWIDYSNHPVDQTPQDGAIAVKTSGQWGHVMIVVAVPGETYAGSVVPSGYIDTFEMNTYLDGKFYVKQRPYSGYYFIH